MNRKKDWILTWTGQEVNPFNMTVDQIDIRDIARALSMQCRYNGHISDFYSVAEHSILISYALERDEYSLNTQKHGLLHDASEAYIGDIPTPIKAQLSTVKLCENEIHKLVAEKFNIEDSPIVHEYDKRIISDERSAFIPLAESHWEWPYKKLNVLPVGMSPRTAEKNFLIRYCELFNEDYQVLRPSWDRENPYPYNKGVGSRKRAGL